jgi:colicin import membrane protein
MTNLIKLETPELMALEPSKAQLIKAAFEPMASMLAEFEEKYNDIIAESKQGITLEVCAKAKRLRLDVGKVRIETGKRKDKQKEYLKLEDRAIMGVHNILVWAVAEKEDNLKNIEDHFEIQEQKRLNQLQAERVELISPYLEDAQLRNLSAMESDVWDAYFNQKKKEYEDRIAAEKQAEADRIEREKAEAEERERIRIENEKLKKEAEEREKQAKIEAEKRAKAEAERIAKEQAERKAAEEKARKEREVYEAQMKIEREQREKAEAELKAKAEAERKAAEEKEALIQSELSKGDADKVNDLIADLTSLKTKYQFKSEKNKKKYKGVGELIDKVINYINN